MNTRTLRAVAIKDLMEVRKNRIAVLGVVVLTIVISILFPFIITQIASFVTSSTPNLEEIAPFIPPDLAAAVANLEPDQIPIVLFLGYLFAPLFLVIPLMLATTIAAEAFVGEKERRTLEPLLYTPATDMELYAGKVLASFIPAVLFAWVNFAIYTVTANAGAWGVMHRLWFPTDVWWVLVFWVSPAIALMGVSGTVLISTKVNTFMEAYQASGALALLVVVLLMGQVFGLIFLSPAVLFLVGTAFFGLDILLIRVGVRLFNRSDLIARV